MKAEPLVIEIKDGRFGHFVLQIDPRYVARLDPRSAITDRKFLDAILSGTIMMGLSILTSEVSPRERMELKQMFIDKFQLTLAQVQVKRQEMKAKQNRPPL